MKINKFQVLLRTIIFLSSSASLAATSPSIHGAKIYGSRVGTPFLFLIPTTGDAPIRFSAKNLPAGLQLDANTGIITGQMNQSGRFEVAITASNAAGSSVSKLTLVSDERSLAMTPAMGWNSWNVWGCDVDEAKIRAAADAMVSSGLAAHGFQYINVDDCWQGPRAANGEIQTNAKFGDMKALADYIHSKGLKFGVYSSPGPKTCQGYSGSLHHEKQDAETYAAWGVDYLKYDWCSYQGDLKYPYQLMGEALLNSRRSIVYSLCQYGAGQVWEWGADLGGNSWRTTGDIEDKWESIVNIGFGQNGLERFSGPGHWNDPDMLVLGKLGWGNDTHPTHLTLDEQKTHITLWSMLAAPLLIGADLKELDDATRTLLTNDELIAIDQDALGKQARRVSSSHGIQVWTRPLADGSTAVGVFNTSDEQQNYIVKLAGLGLAGPQSIRDIWIHKDLGSSHDSVMAAVPSHGVVIYRISPSAKQHL